MTPASSGTSRPSPSGGYRLVALVEPERGNTVVVGEMSPDPPQESQSSHRPAPTVKGRGRARLGQAVIGLMIALVLSIAWVRQRQVPGPDIIRIIVLPFENLGKPEDPYLRPG